MHDDCFDVVQAVSIGKGLRPSYIQGCGVDALYNVSSKFNGFQRSPPSAPFPKSKRF
jgi:hypothetical protein